MQKNLRLFSTCASIVGVVSFVMAASSAQAGFQWTPPKSVESVAPATPKSPAPIVIEGQEPARIIEAPKPPPTSSSSSVQMFPATPPAQPPAPTVAVADGGVVRGFADNVPLSVALRQIIPSQMSFSVAQDVSLGTLVSWKGGAAWRPTLKTMLVPAGLTFKEEGPIVQIVRDLSGHVLVPPPHAKPLTGDVALSPRTDKTSVSVADSVTEVKSGPVSVRASTVEVDKTPKVLPLAPMPAPSAPLSLAPSVPVASANPAPVVAPLVPNASTTPQPSMGYLVAPVASRAIAAPVSEQAYTSPNYPVVESWNASRGDMLRDVLEKWGRKANVEVNWQAEYDYPLQASIALTGSFEEAVRRLLQGFQDAQPQPTGHLYNNTAAGQTVLVIQARGNV